MSYLENEEATAYVKSIEGYGRISTKEEQELAKKIQETDCPDAVEKLVLANLKLVITIAYKFSRTVSIDLMDLIGCGNMGLMTAARKYKPDAGAKFSSYASWWIKQAIRVEIANFAGTIRIPKTANARILELKRICSEYQEEFNQQPSVGELVELSGFPEQAIINCIESLNITPLSLDSNIDDGEGGEVCYMESVSDTTSVMPYQKLLNGEYNDDIINSLNKLDKRSARIIRMRFGLFEDRDPLVHEEIALVCNVSQQRVQQIIKKNLDILKVKMPKHMDHV